MYVFPMQFNQIATFAIVFLLFQLGFEYLRGTQMSGSLFIGLIATTIVATAFYTLFTRWMSRRKNRRD